MPGSEDLRRTLNRIDGRGYKAYREIRDCFDFGSMALHVDHVQGDPFAAPTKLRLRVDRDATDLPRDLYGNRVRRMAFSDYLARRVRNAISELRSAMSSQSTSARTMYERAFCFSSDTNTICP